MTAGLDGKTRFLGLLGNPVKHTASPVMQNAAFEAMGLNCVYLAFEVSPNDLDAAVAGLRALHCMGANVTIPYKQEVIPLLDGISGEARLIGAVNTIKVENKRLVGHNTDGKGFVQALREEARIELSGKKMVLVGAGGAGRAVGVQSGLEGLSEIAILDEQDSRAEKLAAHITAKIPTCKATGIVSGHRDAIAAQLADADIVVDATPLGMHPSDPMSLDPALLSKRSVVVDLVYNPAETKLLKAAKKRGCKVYNGMGMLLYQGVLAFELWTGRRAPVPLMRKALQKALSA